MWFIGDCHGQFKTYFWATHKMQLGKDRSETMSYAPPMEEMPASVAKDVYVGDDSTNNKMDCSLQIGDMGIFDESDMGEIPKLENHKFFRGNHDNPQLCYEHPNYLTDYGYFEKQEMFVLAGGFSIDRERRVPGVTWWEDEEIDHKNLQIACEQFADTKPKIMVSHECPSVIKDRAITNVMKDMVASRTELALQTMFESHKPDLWIFGHHHNRIDVLDDSTQGVRFVGLNELMRGPIKDCIFEVPGLEW